MKLEKQTTWSERSDHLTIEAKHWHSEYDRNRWAVYVDVREGHPRFKDLENLTNEMEVPMDIPFHGGCTFIEHSTYRGQQSVRIGADYQHGFDDKFRTMTAEGGVPGQILQDMEDLATYFAG